MAALKADAEIEITRIKAGVTVQSQREKDDAALVQAGVEHQHALQEAILEANLTPEPQMQEQV